MKKKSYYSALTIAGSDSGGGAGIQADLKTFSALGCFGTSAITAVTVQNTRGVFDIHSIPPAIVRKQINVVLDDISPKAVKIGMVHSSELALTIADALRNYASPVIFDPVMVATSGDRLIEENTIEDLRKNLFTISSLITPNMHEAEILSGLKIKSKDDMCAAAKKILTSGCQAVLVKGGHLKSLKLYDFYMDDKGNEEFYESESINTPNTHGTGCTLSSAIAAFCARGFPLRDAIREARNYVHQAIDNGKDVRTGYGHGPLNHFFNPQKLITYDLE